MPYKYYIAVVYDDDTVLLRQNDKFQRQIVKQYLTEKSKIYRVRGHTVDHAVRELSEFLGRPLTKVNSRRKKYEKVSEIKEL